MKRTAVCLAGISSMVLLSATLLHAAEQKIIFNAERVEFRSGTGAKYCEDKCGRRSGPDVKALLAEGWKILSSTTKRVIAEGYWYTPCNTCEPHGCDCIGTEYVLQKEGPAPKVETSSNEAVIPAKKERSEPPVPKAGSTTGGVVAPGKSKMSELLAPKGEIPSSEIDLLKKENELLKQEITILKQEMEKIRNQRR